MVKGKKRSSHSRLNGPPHGRQSRTETKLTQSVQAGGSRLHSEDLTRESLLKAAKKLFSQKGYDGTSVKELSDEAKVNISLTSYHFGGKEGLYRSCLEKFGTDLLAETERLLRPPESPDEFKLRLHMFSEFIVDKIITEPELSQISFRECDLETPLVEDIFQTSFIGIFRAIISFFEVSQKKGFVEPELDPHTLASLFFGSLSHFARMDKLSFKYFKRTIHEEKTKKKVLSHLSKIFSGKTI